MTGEGLKVGKVRSCAVYLILAHFVFKSILWIRYFTTHSSFGKDELALNGGGSCAVYLVLASSVSFCFQVNTLTKAMFFALNWIGLTDHISRDRRAHYLDRKLEWSLSSTNTFSPFLFLLYPHSTCWLSREIREILSRLSWLNFQRSIAGVLEIKRLWSRSNPFTTLNGRSSCKVFSNILQRAFNLEKLQIEMRTKTRTNSLKIGIA